jgi:hypothetical protein
LQRVLQREVMVGGGAACPDAVEAVARDAAGEVSVQLDARGQISKVAEKGAANGHGRPSAGGEAGAGRREQEGAGADAGTATGDRRGAAQAQAQAQAQAGTGTGKVGARVWEGLGRVMGYGLRDIWGVIRCGIREAGTCFDLGQARVRRGAASSHGTGHGMRRASECGQVERRIRGKWAMGKGKWGIGNAANGQVSRQ